MITWEVAEALHEVLASRTSGNTNPPADIYSFERALQGPILEMMQRGFLVNETERRRAITALDAKVLKLDAILQKYSWAVWGRSLNPASPAQLAQFFYQHMRLPEQHVSVKGISRVSTNRDSLEKLELYFHAKPIIATILAIKDAQKKLQVLRTEVDPDGRMRTSYNIAGTETGRLSSSASAFDTGSNLQNITESLRRVFVADKKKKICVIDYSQSEARDVGFLCGLLFGDWTYLDNCESGDLHTNNAKLIWPELPWTGDPKKDREIAEQPFYMDYSHRHMAKMGGHGTTYMGTPFTMGRHLKVPTSVMEDFQRRFFFAFPCIPKWHRWTAQEIQTKQLLLTPFGRQRHFFGRPNDDATLREAIAFVPQSMTADRTNLALYRVWKELGSSVQILAQTHDSITFQYDEPLEDAIIPKALKLLEIPLYHSGRKYVVEAEPKSGWNWMKHHDTSKPTGPKNLFNPNGLVKWRGNDPRKRLVGMDNPLS